MTRIHDVTPIAKPGAEARLIVDGIGAIRDANAAAYRLLGYQAGTLRGLSLAWIMPPSQHALIPQLTSAWKEGRRMLASSTFMRDDGSSLSLIISAEPCGSERGHELSLRLEGDEEPTLALQRSAPSVAPPGVSRAAPMARGRRQRKGGRRVSPPAARRALRPRSPSHRPYRRPRTQVLWRARPMTRANRSRLVWSSCAGSTRSSGERDRVRPSVTERWCASCCRRRAR